MLSIEGSLERRRRRGQDEINVLVREFSESGLSQKEFALKVGVHPREPCGLAYGYINPLTEENLKITHH